MFESTWYYNLNHPPLTPPGWIFTPAWITLYTLIFIALVLFITQRSEKSKMWGYVLFFGQLVFNFLWSPIFFSLHNLGFSLLVIIIMDILVLFNIKEFYEISQKAAYFLIPYFCWILFATYLNAGLFVLN